VLRLSRPNDDFLDLAGVPKALTVAGSDSGGGAGIQADLKTFVAHGVYGSSALTAITAQNTRGVFAVAEVPEEVVAAQIDAVLEDIGADAAKTGMLSSASIVEVVADRLEAWGLTRLVVDPVMVAKSGDRLLQADAVEAIRRVLLPLALVVTPNRPEAEVLAGRSIATDQDARDAAAAIAQLGPRFVVVKGGHRAGDPLDIVFDGRDYVELSGERIETRNTHGTGDTFSAAIAAHLARGAEPLAAIAAAKRYLTESLRASYPVGAGHSGVNHFPTGRIPDGHTELPAVAGAATAAGS
jgi:hydroxymethylpyrimidine/phosphomethylpyrimidine kinase